MFLDFDLDMCFSPQGRAIFPHLHFHKWSETVSFLAFWLDNALCATAGCHFPHPNFQKWCENGVFCTFWLGNALCAAVAWYISTSQLPKVVRASRRLYLLSWKCASRHSGVPFFHIRTSKSGACFLPFESKICFQRGVQIFISPLTRCLRARRFEEPTFRPSGPTNIGKRKMFCDFPNISRTCMFFLLTLLFRPSTLLFYSFLPCFSFLYIAGSLASKLSSIKIHK